MKTQNFIGADFNLTHGAVRKDPRRVGFEGQRILGVLEDFEAAFKLC